MSFPRDQGSPVWSRILAPRPGAQDQAGADSAASRAWMPARGASRLPPPDGALPGCPLPWDWESRAYLALDFETTGLDAVSGRIVEVGAVAFSYDGEGALMVEREWGSLVNPGMPIPDSATAVHGITDLEVSQAPRFVGLASELCALIAGRVIVAHNAPFDMGFLIAECARCSAAVPDTDVADSLGLARMAFPSFMGFSLGKLAFRLGIETGSAHRALDDAKTCMHVFTRAARSVAGKGSCP